MPSLKQEKQLPEATFAVERDGSIRQTDGPPFVRCLVSPWGWDVGTGRARPTGERIELLLPPERATVGRVVAVGYASAEARKAAVRRAWKSYAIGIRRQETYRIVEMLADGRTTEMTPPESEAAF